MAGMTRKRLLQYGAGAGAALALPWGVRPAAAAPGGKLAKYVERLPLPGDGIVVAGGTAISGGTRYEFTQKAISRQLHPQLPPTPFWAYDDGSGLGGQAGSFGMLLVARRDELVEASFTNDLPATYPSWIPVDERLTPFGSEVRVLTHLHGGFVAAEDDGNPAADPDLYPLGSTQVARYPNEQPATLLWFHDHGLGTTRLNVFAGLAAGYLIRDEYDTGEPDNENGLPSGPYEIPLVIQDRLINTANGQLVYPASLIPGVTWIGEYFGDTMLVNGKVWPYLELEPRLYRLRILNGCNARILNLNFPGTRVWQIGAEGGLFDAPVPLGNSALLGPAERADLLVDFSRLAGQTTVLKNNPVRKPVVSPAAPLNQVMELRVGAGTPLPPVIPATLAGGSAASLPAGGEKRYVTLNEVGIDTADWKLTLNGVDFMDPDEDEREVGDVEDWYYINLTGDTHPMHTHLFMHQVVGRVPFDAAAYAAAAPSTGLGSAAIDPAPFFRGPIVGPEAGERGWKDTTMAHPGHVTIIRGQFDLPSTAGDEPQTYVHHCHIVEHEDNDMMRPFTVG